MRGCVTPSPSGVRDSDGGGVLLGGRSFSSFTSPQSWERVTRGGGGGLKRERGHMSAAAFQK